MEIKEKLYIGTIVLLLCLVAWLWSPPQTLNEKLINEGAAMVFAPKLSKLNKPSVYDLIRNEKVEPCRQAQEKTSTQKNSKKECDVEVTEVDGKLVLITKKGERIIPDEVLNHKIIRYKKNGSRAKKSAFQLIQPISSANAEEPEICLSDLNGFQYEMCWPESVVREYCRTTSDPLCNLI